eukprot:706181-Pelagomonas_calceolata.AAC.1
MAVPSMADLTPYHRTYLALCNVLPLPWHPLSWQKMPARTSWKNTGQPAGKGAPVVNLTIHGSGILQ